MNDIEQRIRELPRPAVPDRLDRRVKELVDRRSEANGLGRPRRVPLWAAAAACLVCAALGAVLALALAGRPAPPTPTVVYVLEPSPGLRAALGESPAPPSGGFFSRSWHRVEALAVAGASAAGPSPSGPDRQRPRRSGGA